MNAQTTAEQQKRSLEETNRLKLGLDTSLKGSDEIAQGMNNSLTILSFRANFVEVCGIGRLRAANRFLILQ